MRRASILLVVFATLALAADPTEIQVYRKGKVLSVDKEQGQTLYEAFLDTWSCETGIREKSERIEIYCHLSEEGEVLTPRAICDRCRERFQLDKKGTKWIFSGVKKETPKETKKPEKKPEAAAISSDALAELKSKSTAAALEIAKIDPREASSAQKRRKIIEDRGLQVAFNEWNADGTAATAVSDAIEAKTDLSVENRYYVLRSFGWQRYHEHDLRSAALFYERCVRMIPEWSSGHYDFALVKKEQKDVEGEIVELARALRGKAVRKYATHLEDALKTAKPTKRLDAPALEKLTGLVQQAKERLEQTPPDGAGAKKVADEIGKLVDERFPVEKRSGVTPEPGEE